MNKTEYTSIVSERMIFIFGYNPIINIIWNDKNPAKNSLIEYLHPKRMLPSMTTYNSIMRKNWTGNLPNLTEDEIIANVYTSEYRIIDIQFVKPLKNSIIKYITSSGRESFTTYHSFKKEKFKGESPKLTYIDIMLLAKRKEKELNLKLMEIKTLQGSNTRILFKRNDNTVWDTSYFNLQQGASSGRGGFDKTKMATFYINKFKLNDITYYKYGVSTQFNLRKKRSSKNNDISIENIFTYEDSGYIIWELESRIKKKFKGVLTKQLLPDGYSETINSNDLHILIEFMNNIIKELTSS